MHYACLGDWLIDTAMNEWLGRMRPHEKQAMRTRLGLPEPQRQSLPRLRDAAATVKYTGAWLSQQVQAPAIRHMEDRVAALDERPGRLKERRKQRDRLRELAEELLDLTAS